MPEGDTVYRAARQLDRALTGQVLTRTDFRMPELATIDLSGRPVTGTISRGKHLLTRIGDDHTLHTHLKMEGVWQVLRPGQRWRRPAHEARVVLDTASTQAVGFALGIVDLVPRDQEAECVAHLGPDLLGVDWDPDEAVRRLQREPDREIGEALLDQTNLAGVGNVFRSELCFVAGLHPLTPVSAAPDLGRLVRRAQQMLEVNKGRTTRCTTGDLRRGQSLWVYGRRGEPCRRCGTPVTRAEWGELGRERPVYFCPSCQPER